MSQINADTIANKAGSGPAVLTGQCAARAFVTYSHEAAADDSLNISSVTDVAYARFTPNFTNDMANAAYTCVVHMQISLNKGAMRSAILRSRAAGSFTTVGVQQAGQASESVIAYHTAAVFGDLA